MSIITVNFKSRVSTVTSGIVFSLDAGDLASYVSGSTTWYDLTRNGRNATLTNGPAYSGSNGGVIVLDGINDYLSLTLPTFSSTYSLSFWFKPISFPAAAGTEIQLFGSPADVASISFYDSVAGVYKVGSWNGGTYRLGATTIAVGSWYNFVMVNNVNTIFYLNGRSDLVSATTATLNSGTATIGAIGNSRFFNAHLGNVTFYNKGLTASEIIQNYNAFKSRFIL